MSAEMIHTPSSYITTQLAMLQCKFPGYTFYTDKDWSHNLNHVQLRVCKKPRIVDYNPSEQMALQSPVTGPPILTLCVPAQELTSEVTLTKIALVCG